VKQGRGIIDLPARTDHRQDGHRVDPMGDPHIGGMKRRRSSDRPSVERRSGNASCFRHLGGGNRSSRRSQATPHLAGASGMIDGIQPHARCSLRGQERPLGTREETMCQVGLRHAVAGAGLAAVLAIAAAWLLPAAAQEASQVRVRGTIESVDGAVYTVKARDGAELKITTAEKANIAGLVKASLSDIKQNSFIGTTAMPQADGSLRAL